MPGPANQALGNIALSMVLGVVNTVVTNVGANTSVERNITVPGLRVGDAVSLTKPSFQAGLTIAAVRVTAADTLGVTYVNNTAGAIAPAAETYILQLDRGGVDNIAQLPSAIV